MIRPLDNLEKPDLLAWLQEWYANHCDGVWEHSYGIKIETLDTPGWTISIDLTGTVLADKRFETPTGLQALTSDSELDWIQFEIRDQRFMASCGLHNLGKTIDLFRAFANSAE